MEKTPCIECTSRLWEYIKPYLEKWGYFTDCGNIVDRVGEELVLFIDKSEKHGELVIQILIPKRYLRILRVKTLLTQPTQCFVGVPKTNILK